MACDSGNQDNKYLIVSTYYVPGSVPSAHHVSLVSPPYPPRGADTAITLLFEKWKLRHREGINQLLRPPSWSGADVGGASRWLVTDSAP